MLQTQSSPAANRANACERTIATTLSGSCGGHWSCNTDYIATLGGVAQPSRASPSDLFDHAAVDPRLLKHGAGPQRARRILKNLARACATPTSTRSITLHSPRRSPVAV